MSALARPGMLMASALLLAACDPHPQEKLTYSDNPKAMEAAIAEAKATLPTFWSKFDAAASKEEYSVKIEVPTPPKGSEAIWVDVIERRGDEIVGVLANDPVKFKGHFGDKVTMKTSQIVDWSYPKDGKAYGNYTTRVLTPQMSVEEQAITREHLAATPLEQPIQ